MNKCTSIRCHARDKKCNINRDISKLRGEVYIAARPWGPTATLAKDGTIKPLPETKHECVQACQQHTQCASWIFAVDGAPSTISSLPRNTCILLDAEHLDVVPINFDAQLMESGQCNPMEASFVVKHFSEKAHLGIVYADKHRCYKLKEEDECYCECFVKSHSHSGL